MYIYSLRSVETKLYILSTVLDSISPLYKKKKASSRCVNHKIALLSHPKGRSDMLHVKQANFVGAYKKVSVSRQINKHALFCASTQIKRYSVIYEKGSVHHLKLHQEENFICDVGGNSSGIFRGSRIGIIFFKTTLCARASS